MDTQDVLTDPNKTVKEKVTLVLNLVREGWWCVDVSAEAIVKLFNPVGGDMLNGEQATRVQGPVLLKLACAERPQSLGIVNKSGAWNLDKFETHIAMCTPCRQFADGINSMIHQREREL